MTKIAVFVGSLQEKSWNKMLAKSLEALKPEGMEFKYVDINLPLFNEDLEADFPAEAKRIKETVEAADGVLFVTPEYNRGIPGVLKNAIDWTSRPWGDNSFKDKPVGIVGASVGPVGTAVAQSNLRHTAAFLSMKQFGQPEIYIANADSVFSEDGNLVDERWRKNIQQYINVFADWVEDNK